MEHLARTIVYKWSREDGGDISEDQRDSLDVIATRVIYSAMSDGLNEGKLSYYFSGVGKFFYGYWYFNKEKHYKNYLPEWAKNQGEPK
jgi:hypothetical protein